MKVAGVYSITHITRSSAMLHAELSSQWLTNTPYNTPAFACEYSIHANCNQAKVTGSTCTHAWRKGCHASPVTGKVSWLDQIATVHSHCRESASFTMCSGNSVQPSQQMKGSNCKLLFNNRKLRVSQNPFLVLSCSAKKWQAVTPHSLLGTTKGKQSCRH